MIRHTITLPLADNDGLPLDSTHDILRGWLLERAAGYTASDSAGAWRGDGGAVYTERVTVYAVDTPDPHFADDLDAMAASIASHARQECVYVTHQPITTHYAAPVAVEAAA